MPDISLDKKNVSFRKKLNSLFHEHFNRIVFALSFLILIFILGFFALSFYNFLYLKKKQVTIKKFEINQNFYKEVSQKLEQKKRVDDKFVKEKVEPLSDPFEKK